MLPVFSSVIKLLSFYFLTPIWRILIHFSGLVSSVALFLVSEDKVDTFLVYIEIHCSFEYVLITLTNNAQVLNLRISPREGNSGYLTQRMKLAFSWLTKHAT